MAKFTDGGLVPEDDPIFDGSLMMFSVAKPAQLIESQVSEAFAAPVAAPPEDRENKAATASGRKK